MQLIWWLLPGLIVGIAANKVLKVGPRDIGYDIIAGLVGGILGGLLGGFLFAGVVVVESALFSLLTQVVGAWGLIAVLRGAAFAMSVPSKPSGHMSVPLDASAFAGAVLQSRMAHPLDHMSAPLDASDHREGEVFPLLTPDIQPPRCQMCGSILGTPGYACQACGAAQQAIAQEMLHPQHTASPAMPYPAMVHYVTPPKSAALAVFLTFLWLGLGHLYAGRIATGIVLALVDLVLVMLAFSLVGLIIAFPIWCILFIIAAPLSAMAAGKANGNAVAPYYAAPGR